MALCRPGRAYDDLRSLQSQVASQQVDLLTFDGAGVLVPEGATLRTAWAFLNRHDYAVARLQDDNLQEMSTWDSAFETDATAQFIAISRRIFDLLLNRPNTSMATPPDAFVLSPDMPLDYALSARLKRASTIRATVSFAKGTARSVHVLDDWLLTCGYVRRLARSVTDTAEAEAIYVKRPVVSCSALRTMGRFANQLFQYMFIQAYSDEHGFIARHPVWAGDDMFNCAPGVAVLPDAARTIEETEYEFATSSVPNDPHPQPGADFRGYFQYHSRYYRPYKAMIQSHLAFKGDYARYAGQIADMFAAKQGPVVALHLRRGDYGTGIYFLPPDEWYLDWLYTLRAHHPDMTLFIASDEAEEAKRAFDDFAPMTWQDLPKSDLPHGFFPDFAALTLADYLGTSNSSFSFAASMLNTRARQFMRPSLTEKTLLPYDPWDAPVVLRDLTAEDAGEEYMSARAKSRSKYRLRKLRRRVLGV
ncbi:MAG: hypothetical protein AAFR45_04125 [Pseudomonadota bacterium]